MKNMINASESPRKVPSHEITYCRLRDMILFGQLAPGQPVTIQGLTATLEAGMTPVREAIRKLTAEGALELQGNRRVSVPQLTVSQLDEIAFARLTIEPKLAQMATNHLRANDIAALARIDGEIDQAIAGGDVQRYLRGNFNFHFTLYERAEAPILLSIAQMLWLRFGPSLRVVCGRYGTANLPDRHGEALDAMRSGDAAQLAAALEGDIAQGIEQVRLSLPPSGI
ncbi:GntR family transcriptional regulator [Defluviimonas sp. WL0024]|uniref:GntR family transcriptional regulator n=2 Tax=Albidovulum TaxID=205889 RepID=A0ABT3IZV3_9RHOB|nr:MULTISPECIES: GntR family transcriptional regulator [Defluviimonas]MCU9847158.1 GntR family transcriptional regulator [Defluviimonas sp. WL0024]MCW3780958.1 GntR family transcriptional regulator [Defluviimonas salinarum]